MNFESQPEHSGNSFLRKKFKELPFFFPVDYKNSNVLGAVRVYKLGIGQRIFMTFKDQRGSKLGMATRVLHKTAIIVNAAAYVWSWSPIHMKDPSTCSDPACSNDAVLCPGYMICEPHLDVRMLNVQIVCMLVLLGIFTIPTMFCWSVPARLAGVLDLTDEVQKADEAFSNNENDDNAMRGEGDEETRKRSSSAARQVTQYFGIANGTGGMSSADIDKVDNDFTADPKYSVFKQVCRYMTTGRSLRAIVGNVPLFLVFLTVSDLTGNGLNVYVARMTTLLQLADFISGKKSGQVTSRTLGRAYPTMLFMIWCIFLLAVVVGAIVFLLERGEFTVTEDFPDGAFLRPTVTGRGKEESPFTSMALSLYWVVVTVTSVGYGEMVCTSAYGRLISVMLMILSIFVLALPIAVIGQILTEEMENYVERKAQKETRVAEQIGVDKSSDLLKKYSTAIERRKSQFAFDLPSELKTATERRQSMMIKMKSANDVLGSRRSAVSFEPTPLASDSSTHSPKISRSSASKLFNSWSEADMKEEEGEDSDEVVEKREVDLHPGRTLGKEDSDSSGDNDETFNTQHKEMLRLPPPLPQSKVEAEWNMATSQSPSGRTQKAKRPNDQSPKALSPTVSAPNASNQTRKNRRMASESSLFKKKKMLASNSGGGNCKSAVTKSLQTRNRDIDRELIILERSYLKQMQHCIELHQQISSLMKEKNENVNDAKSML